MSDVLGAALFQSRTRSKVLELLFVRRVRASVSELARAAGVSPRAVSKELRHLLPTGLVEVETVGRTDQVRGNLGHPAVPHLRALLRLSSQADPDEAHSRKVRTSLAGWGAPLVVAAPRRVMGLTETLVEGLREARRDAAVLRVLPTVLARNLDAVDWVALKTSARRARAKSELGLVVELTSRLLDRQDLLQHLDGLRDRRRTRLQYFPEVASRFEEAAARRRSPATAKRWGFWMNLSEDSLRATLERHRA